MNTTQNDFSFSLGMRKILAYYLGYSILFFLIHLGIVSTVTFFHFLIDHDMHVIENWLTSNAWEIIIASKSLAAFFIIKVLKLNNYFVTNFFTILKTDTWKPSLKSVVLICFLGICFFAMIKQFGKGIILNIESTEFAYISFLGSILFYLVDFLVINILLRNVKPFSKRKSSLLIFSLLVIFLSFTKMTLPYINKHIFLLVLHFITLLTLLFNEKKNIMNIILYSTILIGPLSALFGYDLVWENAHSIYTTERSLPMTGIVGIWLIGILYYLRKRKE